ncbi:condensin complex subunit 2 [Echeneis naucrates]|uniref:Condensin complex subunit 2 n=1 Tax=Echeneis naucrates TaxID=173247 RepID=A0A665V9Q5_ECHNA|nr:condensin complex subunit 2 [Echeneis naucrates]XP_029366648.1 condensin complex subunit 2 [Echeneis naucrates]
MSATSTPVSRVRPEWTSTSMKNKSMSPATCSTPLLVAFPGNDDELERRQRRRSRVIDLQAASDSSFNDSASHSVTGTPAAVPKLSNAQISEHYSTCIKLSTENKITTKNAFGLHLIDYMADILKQKDSELTNFKVAAGTLDASTKIYAVRVDAVHADAYRVLGGLGAETKPGEDHTPLEEEGREDDRGEVTAKQSKKKRPPKRTVEQNLSNITSAESERKCEVDPMFQRMASSFDESSTAGVFLSVLFSENCRCELLFPSYMTLLQSRPSYSPPPPLGVSASPFTGGLQCSQEKSSICPSLQDFSFTSWSPEQTINQLLEKMKQGEHVFNVNAEAEPEPEEDDCPDFDADYEEGLGNSEEGTKEHRDGYEASGSSKGSLRDVIPIGEGDITTMCLQLSSQPREYSYFSPRTMATWAGPGYWQFKPKHTLDHLPDREIRKRKPKKTFEIDFNDDINFNTYFRTTRATTTNSKSSLSSSNKKTTLPADFQFTPETLSQLSLKPSSLLTTEGQKRLSAEIGENIGDYDYNNANDMANFCPGLQGDEEEEDDDDGDGDDEGILGSEDIQPSGASIPVASQDLAGVSTYGEENLVPEPHRINKIEINYAKTAKKMDMKRLKNSMWTLLTEGQEKPTELMQTVDQPEVCGEKVFSQTTMTLLQRLPNTMAQNLSVPLAFVALLHLANEKNLELVKVDDMSDIIIRQGQ